MKLLIALSRFPYPIEKGDKLRAYYQIRELSRLHELHLVCLTEKPVNEEHYQEVARFCKEIHCIPLSKFQKMLNLILGVFSSIPFQVHYFKSKLMYTTIEKILQEKKIDLVYTQLIRVAENIPMLNHQKYYIDFMDAFSAGFEKRKSLSRWFEKPFVAIEASRLRQYEESTARKYHGYSIISQADADYFSPEIKDKILVLPNGVGEEFFVSKYADEKKKYDIIFTGNMGYHPNIQAAKYIVEEILPLLHSKGIKPKICLCGTNPSKEILALKSDDIDVTGYVEDMRLYLAKSKLLVAPLFSGSGLQNKLLEAMAFGLPCITSSLANKALKARDKKEIVICNDPKSFSEQILFYLNHDAEARELVKVGRLFIRDNYNWRTWNQVLEKEFLRIITTQE